MPQFSSRLRSLDIKSENPFGRAFGGFDRGFGDVGRDYGYSDRFGDSRKPAIQTYTYTNNDQERGAKANKKPQSMKDFIDDVVKAHNKYRRKHRASDLRHNKEMSALAQSWADHLAKTSTLGHSNHSYKGSELGENVATKWTSTGEDYTGQEVTEQWYKEIEKYNWRAATFQSGTGHFTQVVWKGSREIGVGKSQSRDGRVFVVANYSPAGNVMGQFSENVLAG